MGLFDEKFWKKNKKKETLIWNKVRGQMAEDNFAATERIKGNTVERKPRGRDFKVTERDPWTGKAQRTVHVEVKSSSTAPLSKLQKRTKKRLGNRYRVERPDNYW